MAQPRRRPRKKRTSPLLGLSAVLVVILAGLLVLAIFLDMGPQPPQPTNPSATSTQTTTQTNPTTSTPPTDPPVVKKASATFSAMGDFLMHMPVVNTGYTPSGYNFDSVFRYFSDYIQSADYAIGNLETTLAGTDNGYGYSGYPNFNCPDGIIDGLGAAGFDMILTANNHSYDTRHIGLLRTQQIIADRELQWLGTKMQAQDPNFITVQRNGIRVAMACYTYETDGIADKKALNGHSMTAEDAPLIQSFDYQHLNLFYEEIAESLAQAQEAGADAFVLFLHWGNEYQTKQNATQSAIAQALCDLGVDVIIGGHPHVIQPVELLTSTTDENHKTVCLYSMGNALSNQRRQHMNLNTGHTEDGLMFSLTFSRYSDGTVILEDADILPTWVSMGTNPQSGDWEYNILPLDPEIEDWKAQFDLTDALYNSAKASYDRTLAIVGPGLEAVDRYLAENTAAVETQLGVAQ